MRRLAALRHLLTKALEVLTAAVPSSAALLPRVRGAVDAANTTYDAFCDGAIIVVNLASFLPKLPSAPPACSASSPSLPFAPPPPLAWYPSGLLHDLVLTCAHELAHLIEGSGSHGPGWRQAYDAIVLQAYAHADATAHLRHTAANRPGAGWAASGGQCACGGNAAGAMPLQGGSPLRGARAP
jgi:hypothetical protein